jgi:anthranilate synthase component I
MRRPARLSSRVANIFAMAHHFPDPATFIQRCREEGNDASPCIVPVYRQLLADHVTPVSAFEVLGRDDHAFLLESVVGGERVGRHSFIASGPDAVYTAMGTNAAIRRMGAAASQFQTTDPLGDLAKLLPGGKYLRDPALPAFTGGLVGYAAYDTVRYYEGDKLKNGPADDRNLPDVLMGLYESVVIFDHVDRTLRVVANAHVPAAADDAALQSIYRRAAMQVDEIVSRLRQPPTSLLAEFDPRPALELATSSNMTRQQFEQAVERGLEFIRAGDIFQFVPSQRLRVQSTAAPLDVYRALRVINPSPFMFYLKSPAATLIGSSPEILCRVKDGVVTSRPLAGTRGRGRTEQEDAALEAELLADPKERAEHIMLVDLHRNDIGRVAEPGTVRVDDCMAVERYSHVMHITSNVSGKLRAGLTALDALRTSLPVGTVSGAPKVRAMQIIDEVEPTRRGPYGGAVGYVDFAGNMDMCIALRTIVWHNGSYDVQTGAGVVAESKPGAEYEECMNKAKALLKAVQVAQHGFD